MRFGNFRTFAKISLVISALLLLVGVSMVQAKDDDKTGYEKDDVFHDNRYGYTFELPKEWKVGKTFKDKDDDRSPTRVIVYRKKYRIPVKLQNDRGLVQRPSTIIALDSTNLTPAQFFQEVATAHDLDPFAEDIVKHSFLLQRAAQNKPQVMESLPSQVGKHPATRWKVRLEYAHQVETQFGPELVRGWTIGWIYLVPLDGKLMYIEQACENQSFDTLSPEFEQITNTLMFPGDAPADSTQGDMKGKMKDDDKDSKDDK